ncbi:MAG: thiamine-phosphate kinase [Bacteroidetes bacterium]|nr:thiamine-phosphate kinase [Bacteroidota bacterium]
MTEETQEENTSPQPLSQGEGQEPTKTPVSELGEFGLIDRLTASVKLNHSSTIKGIGDDAAVMDFDGMKTVISTDMYVEGIHFDPVYTPLQHLGYKAVVGSISDIYAMNATPQQIFVSLAFSSKYTIEAMDAIYAGIQVACDNYKVDLAGGDTTSALHGLVISVTVTGIAKAEDITYRSGAKVHDILVVTGDLGGAYLGLQILEREKRIFLEHPTVRPELEGFDYILKRQLRPEARKDIIEIFADLGIKPSAMIDISDGLSSELMHICKQSGVGCLLHEDKIPYDNQTLEVAHTFKIDPTVCALNGGEDYELLFTLPVAQHDKVMNHPDFTIIGYITEAEEGCRLLTRAGNRHALEAQGWKHF